VENQQAKPTREQVLANTFMSIVQAMKFDDELLTKTLKVESEYLQKIRSQEKNIEIRKQDGKNVAMFIKAMGDLYSLVGGKDQAALQWLNEPNTAFDNRKPIVVMQEDGGLAKVSKYLGEANKSH